MRINTLTREIAGIEKTIKNWESKQTSLIEDVKQLGEKFKAIFKRLSPEEKQQQKVEKQLKEEEKQRVEQQIHKLKDLLLEKQKELAALQHPLPAHAERIVQVGAKAAAEVFAKEALKKPGRAIKRGIQQIQQQKEKTTPPEKASEK